MSCFKSFLVVLVFLLSSSAVSLAAPVYGNNARYSLNPHKIQLKVINNTSSQRQEPVKDSDFLGVNSRGEVYMNNLPTLKDRQGAVIGTSQKGETILYSVDPTLHALGKKLISQANAPHIALVAMDPKTGRVLALAERSRTVRRPLLHNKFPAASLFKIVTAAAALETTSLQPYSKIRFRGGNYQLDRRNYTVSARADTRSMAFNEAIGKSCNPVFGRIALKYLDSRRLLQYARQFGFNSDLKFDIPMAESTAIIPNDAYGLSRTAAGFGDVTISPIHAATLMSTIANGGLMPRPYIVEQVINKDSQARYSVKPKIIKTSIRPKTAQTLLQMLESTTKTGTARKEFFDRKGRPFLPGIRVAGKTGTLRGKNPVGLNRWFIGAAPIENPRIAVAVIAVNPVNWQAKPAYIAEKLMQAYLKK